MSVVLFGSSRGSPGVTTAAVGVAACWRDATVVEADADGGVVAARFGLAREPGVLSMAYRSTPGALDAHVQVAPIGVRVVVGPESAAAASAAWHAAGPAIGGCVADAGRDGPVVIDGGRLRSGSPAFEVLASRSALVVLFVRPDAGDVASSAAIATRLADDGYRWGVVVAGEGPYGAGEVASVLGGELVGVVPFDPRAAAGLWSGDPGVGRSGLARSYRSLAERCAQLTATAVVP